MAVAQASELEPVLVSLRTRGRHVRLPQFDDELELFDRLHSLCLWPSWLHWRGIPLPAELPQSGCGRRRRVANERVARDMAQVNGRPLDVQTEVC